MYAMLPHMHNGSGKFWLVLILYVITGILILPVWGLIKLLRIPLIHKSKTGNQIVEILFGNTHLKMSNLVRLGHVERIGFNLPESDELDRVVKDKTLLILSVLLAPEVAVLLMQCSRDALYRANDFRIIKWVALKAILPSLLGNAKVLVQYNDHTPYNFLIQLKAEKIGIKTVYIQHAPIGDHFPPLHHDLNILFSQDSYDKYWRIDAQAFEKNRAEIAFDFRLLAAKEFEHSIKNPNRVLVCINRLDDFTEIKATVEALLQAGYQVLLRPHPEDNRKMPELEGVEVSKGRSIWQDLGECKNVVVNESAVPLEAIYFGNRLYKLNTWSAALDNYNFLSFGLIQKEYDSNEAMIIDMRGDVITFDKSKLSYFVGQTENLEKGMDFLGERIKELA